MARRFNLSRLTKAFTVGAEFAGINLVNQAIQSQANVPPLVKTIVGAETIFASYEIAKAQLDNLPPIVKGIAKPLFVAQESLLAVQLIPSIMAAVQQFSTGGF